MTRKWTREEAWQWANSRPWLMGFNFVPGPIRNGIEQWQESSFVESMEKIERELQLAQDTGFNCMRVMLPEFVWQHQHDSFLRNLETFVSACDRHGLGLMFVFFNDCLVPRRVQEAAPKPRFGPQPDPDWGCHGGTKQTPFDGNKEVGWWEGDDPATWPQKKAFLQDIIGRYAKDLRVICWDIWNEPGNNNRETRSLPLMEKCFEWARELDPIQPLTACAWDFEGNYDAPSEFYGNPMHISAIEKRAIELSDVISFHCYGCLENMEYVVRHLKAFKRPLMNTEWLHRPLHNHVRDMLPLFAREHIGSFHWGLVNGMHQFHEPWDFLRAKVAELGLEIDRWQHDIYRADHTPYDPEEIALFKAYAPGGKG